MKAWFKWPTSVLSQFRIPAAGRGGAVIQGGDHLPSASWQLHRSNRIKVTILLIMYNQKSSPLELFLLMPVAPSDKAKVFPAMGALRSPATIFRIAQRFQ